MMHAAKVKPAYKGTLVLSEDPMVAVMDSVLDEDEIAHIISLASSQIRQATVSLDDEAAVISGRSGSNCWLRYDSDPLVGRVGERIAEIIGIPLTHAEALQVIHYGPDQEYRAHFDAYDLSTVRGQRCCRRGGQRLVTGLVYLNDVEGGGATHFPKLGVSVDPRPGRLAIFHNTGDDITVPHPGSLHAGTPVTRGEKWAFNIWFRARPVTEIQQFNGNTVSSSRVGKTQRATAQPTEGLTAGLIVNRAERLWRKAWENVASNPADGPQLVFTYWDTYGGSQPDQAVEGACASARVVTLLDRSPANALANKATVARALRSTGLGHLAPPSYERLEEALEDNPPGTVWFVKPVFGTAGKGMSCVSAEELSTVELPAHTILQKGVDDLLLDEGRKFTTRVYALIWNGELRLYETGMTVTHGVPYRAGSTDYQVQIDHRGYNDSDAPVKLRPGYKAPAFVEHFPALRNLVRELRPLLAECIRASDRDHYLLLGIDTLIRSDGSAQLIEINSFPNFVHTHEVNEDVNVPMFEAVIRTISGQLDPRFEIL